MKNTTLIAVLIFAITFLSGCVGNKEAEKASQDTKRIAEEIIAKEQEKEFLENTKKQESSSREVDKSKLTKKQKGFKDFVENKLHAKKYTPSTIDTSTWKKFEVEEFDFSFKHPGHVKVELIEEEFDEGVRNVICIKEIEHHQTEDCDIDFIVYSKEGETEFCEGINEYVEVFERSPELRKEGIFEILELEENILLYEETVNQRILFYDYADNLIMIFADPHFFREISDEEIVKAIIQSLKF
jgi:hypothetical protein